MSYENKQIALPSITTIGDLIKHLDKNKFKESFKIVIEQNVMIFRENIRDFYKKMLIEFMDEAIKYNEEKFVETITNLLLCDKDDNASIFHIFLEKYIDKLDLYIHDSLEISIHTWLHIRESIAVSIVIAMSESNNYIEINDMKDHSNYINIISKLYGIFGLNNSIVTKSENVKFYYLKKSFELGNMNDVFHFAILFKRKNKKECLEYFKKVADTNNIDAILMYAQLQVNENNNESRIYFLKAATLGNAHGMYKYGCIIQKENEEDAIKYYKKAIELKNANAMFEYAKIFKDKDTEIFLEYLKMAIKYSNLEAIEMYTDLFADTDPYCKLLYGEMKTVLDPNSVILKYLEELTNLG